MFARKPEMAKEFASKTPSMKKLPEKVGMMRGGEAGAEYMNNPIERYVQSLGPHHEPSHYWHGGESHPGEYLHEEHYPESGRELERKKESEIDAVPDFETVRNTPGEGMAHDETPEDHPAYHQGYQDAMMAMGGKVGYAHGGMSDRGEEEREFLEQDDEDDNEFNTGHQEHYAHGGYLNKPYAEDEASEREEDWEYPESQSNVYGNTEEPEKWTEMGDLEENPDIDEEEEDQKAHARGKGFADGGSVPTGRKHASSTTETGIQGSDYDPYEKATSYSGPSQDDLDKEEEQKARYARALQRRR